MTGTPWRVDDPPFQQDAPNAEAAFAGAGLHLAKYAHADDQLAAGPGFVAIFNRTKIRHAALVYQVGERDNAAAAFERFVHDGQFQ